MRFTQEVNIYAKESILKRFQAVETDFRIQKGKISSLISESELKELQDGKKTMYSRMASTEQTVKGLTQKYADVDGKYDTVSGQYIALNSKVAEYKQSVDDFSTELSKLSTSIQDDYSTTTQVNTAISQKAESIKTEVAKTYATTQQFEDYKKSIVTATKAQIEQKSDELQAWVEQSAFNDLCKNGNFSNGKNYWSCNASKVEIKTEADTKITYALISAGFAIGQEIAAGPEKITVTFDAKMPLTATKIDVIISGKIIETINVNLNKWQSYSVTIDIGSSSTSHVISFKVISTSAPAAITNIRFLETASEYMSSRIQILSDQISSKVSKGSIASEINQTAQSVKISASKINFNGLVTANDYFKINTDGSMEAISGKIAGWDIDTSGFRKGDVLISPDNIGEDDLIFLDGSTKIYGNYVYSEKFECDAINSTSYKANGQEGKTVTYQLVNKNDNNNNFTRYTLKFVKGILVS